MLIEFAAGAANPAAVIPGSPEIVARPAVAEQRYDDVIAPATGATHVCVPPAANWTAIIMPSAERYCSEIARASTMHVDILKRFNWHVYGNRDSSGPAACQNSHIYPRDHV